MELDIESGASGFCAPRMIQVDGGRPRSNPSSDRGARIDGCLVERRTDRTFLIRLFIDFAALDRRRTRQARRTPFS